MDQNIPKMYKRYGQYINSSRSFPLGIDGLKPVERRILLVAYQIARDKMVKCARIDGDTTGKYHPHSSVYGSIVQLANQGFLDKQGNFGNNLGVIPSPAAASRYTECKLNKHIDEMCFKLIKHVPWHIDETDMEEPVYLPTRYPLCLLGNTYTQGIGFGYSTKIPCYSEEDLKSRLIWLLDPNPNKGKGPIIKPVTDCNILSTEDDLEQLLTTGKSKITYQGIVKYDKAHCECHLKSWPSSLSFPVILKKFQSMMDASDIGYSDLSSSETGTDIVFNVLKSRSRDAIFEKLTKIMKVAITSSISFEVTVVGLDGVTFQKSIDSMLLDTYMAYKQANLSYLKHEIKKNQMLVLENEVLLKIKPVLVTELSDDKTSEEIITNISVKTKVPEEEIKVLFDKHKINKLLTIKFDRNIIDEKIKVLQDNLTRLDQFVINQY